MPNRWPINSGSWSVAATWSGSLIPTASDDVFLNNQTITLDQTVTVRSIRNSATSSAVAGGLLNIYADYDITCTTTQSVNAGGLDSSGAIVTGGFVKYYNTGSITITAHLVSTRNTLENVNTGTINIIGDVRIPSNAGPNRQTITNTTTGVINIIGNVQPGNTGQTSNVAILNSVNGTINITGNVAGGTGGSLPFAITNGVLGIINITGNVISGNNAAAISNTGTGTINITGNVTSVTAQPSITSTTAGIINIIGQVIASPTANAISSTSTTATNIFTGPLINSGSRNAIYCYNVRLYDNVTTSYTIGVSGSTDTITLYSPNQIKIPTQNNVRKGITYGVDGEFTGSMNVPDPNTVSWGVPVDNTTGTAVTTPTDLWNYAVTSLTASNSIGQRLANTISSQSMDAIISAF
jgi:hypothetical protein